MNFDEATAVLAADHSAIVFAGRDYDTIAASFGAQHDAEVSPKIAAFRRALSETPNAAARLLLIRNATSELAGVMANRERERAKSEAHMAQHARDVARRHQEHALAQARRERAHRTLFPVFQSLRGRIQAVEAAFGDAATAAELLAAQKSLDDAFATATTSITVGASSLLKAA